MLPRGLISYRISSSLYLKAEISALGEWYSCRRLAFVANSGISPLGFGGLNLFIRLFNCKIELVSTNNCFTLCADIFPMTETFACMCVIIKSSILVCTDSFNYSVKNDYENPNKIDFQT